MASSKLSALTAITSVGDDDLVYIADTSDGGSTYASKKVTKANLFSGFITTAAATTLATDNETHIDNMATLTGVAKDSTGIGTFTGSTISDASTIKAALQDLETAVENAAAGSDVADRTKTVTGDADTTLYVTCVADDNSSATAETVYTDGDITYNPSSNLLTLGTAAVTTLQIGGAAVTSTAAELNLLDGVTSTTAELNILDGVTSTAAEINLLDGVTATTTELNYVDGVTSKVQTQLDTKSETGDNVNVFGGTTTGQTVPQEGGEDNYLFLVVDKSDGSIKAIDKTFIEAEG